MTAFWYSKNLESRNEILEATRSPFLSWKVSANLTASEWRCVYVVFAMGLQTLWEGQRWSNFHFHLLGYWIDWTWKLRHIFLRKRLTRANKIFYGFFEWSLGFIKYNISIYNRKIGNRDFTNFRYMGDLILVV